MNKKQAVIVGCGAIAPIHAAAIEASDYVQLYGVCDIISERMSVIDGDGRPQGSPLRFASIADVIADPNVDAVHICTPHHLHHDMVLACAKVGKAIILEKPVAITMEELQSLSNVEVPTMTVLQNRHNTSVIKAKEIIESCQFGKLLGLRGNVFWLRDAEYYASGDWRGKWATEGGGVVINQSIHTLDLLDWLGGGATHIKGSTDNRWLGDAIEVEDTAEATLYFSGDVRGHFFATNANCRSESVEIVLHFENDTLRYKDGTLTNSKGEIIAEDSTSDGGKACWGDGHKEVIDNFYSTLAGKSAPYPTLGDGIRATALALSLYQSARTGEEIKINFS